MFYQSLVSYLLLNYLFIIHVTIPAALKDVIAVSSFLVSPPVQCYAISSISWPFVIS